MKKCTKCKEEKELSEFYVHKKYKDGYHIYCKKCNKEYNKHHDSPQTRTKWRENNKEYNKKIHREYYINNKEKLNKQSSDYLDTPHGKFLTYKNGAKKRNIDFLLTEEQFITFWNKRCSYCNDEIKTIGIDRIDSKKGYFLENCIPCCSKCNQIKMDLSYNEFINKIYKIYNNLELWKIIEK